MSEGQRLLGEGGCIYVTGSFARGEASENSDLDLFILSESQGEKRLLSNIDGILIMADLVQQAKRLTFPDFSEDGKFLVVHGSNELKQNIGKPEDDFVNTFTARMLLLLESRVLFDHGIYEKVVKEVIECYWTDFDDNRERFIPGFLVNDILRLWRTFCINYEAAADRMSSGDKNDPERKAKRKLKNYKLKHSRLLTCFSAVAFLLKVYNDRKTVTPVDAWEMVQLTPTQRLQHLQHMLDDNAQACRLIDQSLAHYERFLEVTGRPRQEVVDRFKAKIDDLEPYAFGDCIHQLLSLMGGGLMHRIVTI